MDVLKPQLIYIGGRCYRKNPIQNAGAVEDLGGYREDEMDLAEQGIYNDEVCDIMSNIEKTENGYRTKLTIPSGFFKFIIGKKGETKRRIENETRTQIRIPKQGQEGDIVINGHDKKGVSSAKTRIEVLVESARQRETFTHFISIPVVGQTIKDRFQEFKQDVLLHCDGDQGIDATIFQNPSKLHMTIGTLVLMDDAEVTKATEILEQCNEDIISPILQGQPLIGLFRGLEYMNDDPSAVDVLYGKMNLQDDSDKLQILCDRIVEKFTSAGYMQRERDRVKLHVTLMNTLMRKDPSGAALPRQQGGRRGEFKERESFDASNVLRLFGDHDFGKYHIDSVHISQKHVTREDGYYAPAAVITLP